MSANAVADELRVESRQEGPIARWIDVEVPASRVATAFERAYRGLAPASLLMCLGGIAMLYYNWRVTGNALLMPYAASAASPR